MLETKDLRFSYNKDVAFNFPDIACESGQTCLLIGKSGVGKTTLLHLLGGLIKPSQGDLSIDDKNLNSLRGSSLDQFRGQNIGIVFQKPHFISSISILQNLLLTQKLAGNKQDKGQIQQLLEKLGIADRGNSKPQQLSQGELQRASVARAVLNRPKVLLADEPTSALDDESCQQVIELLQRTASELKAALIIVTHDSRLKEIISHQIMLT